MRIWLTGEDLRQVLSETSLVLRWISSWSSPSVNNQLQSMCSCKLTCRAAAIASNPLWWKLSVQHLRHQTIPVFWQSASMTKHLMCVHAFECVWNTILVFILAESRGLICGERCYSLLTILLTRSARSHLSTALCLARKSQHPNTFLHVFLSDGAISHQASSLLQQTQALGLRLIEQMCSSWRAQGTWFVQV